MEVQNLDFAYVRTQASGKDCPLTMTITRSAGAGETLLPLANTEFVFTATLNLGTNAFDLHALPTYVPDPVTFRPVQIGHANVHTCSRTTVCDVFRTGSARKITAQETSNFTGDSATFYQKMAFDRAGDYNVFAHVIIPPANPQNSSYHFITFMTATVAATGSSSNASSGMSTPAIIGLVVGGITLVVLVVLAIVFCKRKKPSNPGDDMFRSSGGGFMPTLTTKHHSRLGGASTGLGGTGGGGGGDWLHHDGDFQFKDTYHSGHAQSEYRQPPGLSASALAFHERVSSRHQPKTASSSGSFRASSPKMVGYDDFASPAAAAPSTHFQHQHSGNNAGGRSGTSNAYYSNGGGGGGGFHRVDDEAFRIPSAIIKSFESDNSMGTSLGFNADSHYTPYRGPGASGFDRESDLSSLHDDDNDPYRHHHGGDALQTLDEGRMSDISMATVDFTLHRPQPPRAVPYQRELDRSMATVDFNSTNRSAEVFDFRETDYHPSAGAKAAAAAPRGVPQSTAASANGAPRDGRTLSDGESYEF